MNNELERKWTEAVVAKFEVLLWLLHGFTEGKHKRAPLG
jgi:hypothetical protein